MSRTALSEYNAEIVIREFKSKIFKVLQFDCPECGTSSYINEDHKIEIPFSDTGESVFGDDGQLIALVWLQLGKDDIDLITLSPSFRNRGACNIHGHVRDGMWEPCP